MQNVMAPVNDVAAKAALARPSLEYGNTANELGYYGTGVVIAVMDTGVDNEHRSLNDFDDVDDAPDADASTYSDQKWVAGFDATSPNPNPDGSTDPDDGNGHGTHVAGSALGTGIHRVFTEEQHLVLLWLTSKSSQMAEEPIHKRVWQAFSG